MSKYDEILTAAALVEEVQINGLSLDQSDICRAQDIFGSTAIEELARLANDVGRNNENGEPDPNGTWSSDRKATQGTFYMILTHIWNWEDVTRFWNLNTNPEHKKLEELRAGYKALEKEVARLVGDVKREHELRLTETSEKLEANQRKAIMEAELHDRDMTIMELKAKLYDLVVAGKREAK